LWSGFALFCSYAINAASIGPVCELLLRLPPDRLEQLLKETPMVDQNAKAKLADYISRLGDRQIDQETLRIVGLEGEQS
jgi:hypothetical protein